MAAKSHKDLFQIGDAPVHPRLRRWRDFHSSGYSLDLEIRRKWDGLTFPPAKMLVAVRQRHEDSGAPEELLWEDELNQGLVELGVKACDRENEVIRYSLALRSAFEPVWLRHGLLLRGLLVEFLRDNDVASDLVATPKLEKMLKQIHAKTYRGVAREQALEAIEAIVKAKALELTTQLQYSRESAVDILARALAQYLDEIFHVTARQSWFPKVGNK